MTVAVVTGANRGIGLGGGRELAARAALLPDDGPTGGLFRDGEPLPW